MKKRKNALFLSLSAVLLVALTVVGTLAFLQSTAGPVTNTFTAGKVAITLDEAPVNTYGVKEDGERRQANAYTLIPGHSYTKDPVVHVEVGSEPSWVYVKVENGLEDQLAEKTIAEQMSAKGWKRVEGYSDLWKYKTEVDARDKAEDLIVFETFKLKDDVKVTDYEDASIVIKAFAIQADDISEAQALAGAVAALAPTTATP